MEWADRVELGRVLADAPRLGRADVARLGPEDPKWKLGDLAAEIPDEQLDRFAKEIGLSGADLRGYRRVSEAWPKERRIAASWSAHRELKDHAERFELIRPAMSMREAGRAAGKPPIDAGRALHNLPDDELADLAISLLQKKKLNDLVTQKLQEQKAARRMRAAAKSADDEQSAEYREAHRAYRQAQAAKSPEVAVFDAIFKMRELAEYVRILPEWDRSGGLPAHRRDDVVKAIRDAFDATGDALDEMNTGYFQSSSSADAIIDVDEASPRPQLLESDD